MSKSLFALNEDESTRYVRRYSNVSIMTCRKCGCLLYRSNAQKPEGQFDLINAKYCPECGRKFKCDEYSSSQKT